MRVLVVTHPTPSDIRKVIDLKADDYIIAVDQSVLSLYKQRIKIDLAIGDFDSLTNTGVLRQLNTIKLPDEKDVTDTFQAIVEAYQMEPEDVFLIGGIGGDRIEHFYGHLLLFNRFPFLKIFDDHTHIQLLESGKHEVDSQDYISFFAFHDATITLEGFKYPLNEYHLTSYDSLGISNELLEKKGHITIHHGRVICFESKREKK